MDDLLCKVREMTMNGLIPLEAIRSIINDHESMVLVDRNVTPKYSDFFKEFLYPELEKVGPMSFNVLKLDRYRNLKQLDSVVKKKEVYELLSDDGLFANCLGIFELLMIQKRGVTFFRKFFPEKVVFGWKSIARYHDDAIYVPYLLVRASGMVLGWNWIDNYWSCNYSALYFID